jgi:hypothetical protein
MFVALGSITVPTPGTPVQATSGLASPSAYKLCHGIMIESLPSNVGKIYIGLVGLVKGTYVGVLAVLPAPTANSYPSWSASIGYAPNAIEATQVYIDADSANDGAIISLVTA